MTPVACKSVFVVDDDVAIRDMLSEALEDEGYNVTSASNGLEAINHLRAYPDSPCLILLDLNMPIMTGWEFRSLQQQDPALAAIPVVVVSADRAAQYDPRPLDAVEYLVKPINLDRLLTLVDRFCGEN